MQFDEPGLFDLPEEPAERVQPEPLINEDQVAAIRAAFERAGITSMKERQELVQSCVIRQVASIREVYAHEARRILKRIEDRKPQRAASSGSAWDNRDEPTWIDKL